MKNIRNQIVTISSAVGVLVTLLFFQNCGNIGLQRMPQNAPTVVPVETPTLTETTPVIPITETPTPIVSTVGKVDTVTYGTPYPPTTGGCAAYSGDYQLLRPTNVANTITFQNVTYPLAIIGKVFIGQCNEGGGTEYTLDPLAAIGFDSRHMKLKGVYSFRIRTPKKTSVINTMYGYQNVGSPPSGYFYSISKVPGFIDPAKPDSTEYCNFGQGGSFIVSDKAGVKKNTCRILQDAVYYINILGTEDVPSGYYDASTRMSMSARLIELNCPGTSSTEAYYCPYVGI